jgi:hypothetical protein
MLCFAMAHLDIERNAAVRAFVEKRLAEHYKGNRSAYAKASKLSPSIVTELLNGGRGAGLRVVDRIAAEAGVSPDVVTGRAVPVEPHADAEPALGGTAWGNLTGWTESEDEVRKADKRWADWQYAKARAIRGFQPPVPVTPAVVVQALMLVFATTPADELARLEAERQDAELRRMQKAAETRASKRK